MTRKRSVCVLGLVVALFMSCGCWDRSGHKLRFESDVERLSYLCATIDDSEVRARAQVARSRLLDNKTEETPYMVAAEVFRLRDSNRIVLGASYVTEVYAGGYLEITGRGGKVSISIGEVTPLKKADKAYRTIVISEEKWEKASSVPLRELKDAEIRIVIHTERSDPILIRIRE